MQFIAIYSVYLQYDTSMHPTAGKNLLHRTKKREKN